MTATPTLADARALDDEIRATTALLAVVTGRRGLDDAQRTEHLRRIAAHGSPLAAPTLVIELARGTPLTDELAWVERAIAIVAAAPTLGGIAPRLERRFLVDRAPGDAPLLEPAMVTAVLDGEVANLQAVERALPTLLARAATLSAALTE